MSSGFDCKEDDGDDNYSHHHGVGGSVDFFFSVEMLFVSVEEILFFSVEHGGLEVFCFSHHRDDCCCSNNRCLHHHN